MRLFTLIGLLFYYTLLTGQNVTELWFSESDSISSIALDIVHDPQSQTFFMLSHAQEFYNTGTSIPTNGWYTLGSMIRTFDENINVLWDSIYPTNCSDYCSNGDELYGRLPGNKLLFNSTGSILLPYEDYGGIRPCNENFNISFFERILEINTQNGDVLNDNNRFYEDLECTNEDIRSVSSSISGAIRLLIENPLSDDVYIREYDENLVLLDSVAYQNGIRPNYLSQSSTIAYDLRRDKLIATDAVSGLIDSVDLFSVVDLYGGAIRLYESSEYISIIENGRDIDNIEHSTIWILNHMLEIISTNTINLKRYDQALLVDDKLLAIDQQRIDYNSPSEIGFTIDIYDLNLNVAAPSQSFGDPYTRVTNLKRLPNNTIGFVGGRYKSFDIVGEQAPDQAYLLLLNELDLLTSSYIAEDKFTDFDIQIFPNPAKSSIRIELPEKADLEFIEVIETTGQVISMIDLSTYPRGNIYDISLDNIPSGVYFLRFKNGAETLTRKIIKM